MPPYPTDSTCILCKIAAGTIPCFKLFEDEMVLAFLDISPLTLGHTLVIPKAHHATVMETPPEIMAEVNKRIPAISRAVLAIAGAPACHVLTNNGPAAMQTIPHLHYHIIPRQAGDGFHIPWNTKPLDKSAGAAMAESIKKYLAHADS